MTSVILKDLGWVNEKPTTNSHTIVSNLFAIFSKNNIPVIVLEMKRFDIKR